MTKEVLVSVTGKQILDGEEDINETISAGTYYYRGGKHYVLYDSYNDDQKTENIIKFNNDIVEVSRKGEMVGKIIYECNKHNESVYTTPVGDLLMDIYTHDIDIVQKDDIIKATISYEIYVEKEKVSDNEVLIEIKSKK